MNKRMRKKQFGETLHESFRAIKFMLSLPKERIVHKLIHQDKDCKTYKIYDKKTGKVFLTEDVLPLKKKSK